MKKIRKQNAKELLVQIKSNPRLTPIMLAERLKWNIGTVRNALVMLFELGLIDRPARGVYEITKAGDSVLSQVEVGKTWSS